MCNEAMQNPSHLALYTNGMDACPSKDWELCDVFCGGGLFSYAARDAGMEVVSAVDNSADALVVYKLNQSPSTVASCATVGPEKTEFTLPPPKPRLHIHLSPPCVDLSHAKRGARSEEGVAMLKSSIGVGLRYHSFSVETVFTSETLRIAKESAEEDDRISHGVYDAINFGAPQNRQRLIIATQGIIKRLNEAPISRRLSVLDAFRNAGVSIPKGGTHMKNSSLLTEGTSLRPITGPAFTCCASRALSWCTSTGETVMSMKPIHTHVLMGLPTTFTLSGKQRIDQRVLGNGVAYGLARAIALAAMEKPIPAERGRGDESTSLVLARKGKERIHCLCDELEARLVRVEHRLQLLSRKRRRDSSKLEA